MPRFSLILLPALAVLFLGGCGRPSSGPLPPPPARHAQPSAVYQDAETCARHWGVTFRYIPGSHATFSDPGRELICCPSLKSALIDGSPVRLQEPVELRNGQLLLPSALVAAVDRAWAGRPAPRPAAPPEPPLPEAPQPPCFRIVIDPGHGGSSLTGAQGSRGLYEKTVNLMIARELRDLLEARGAEVVMLRNEDRAFYPAALEGAGYKEQQKADLAERIRLSNRAQPDLFISIHANWAPSSDAEGFEVYYPRPPASAQPPPRRGKRRFEPWSAYGSEILKGGGSKEETRWEACRSLAESLRRAMRGGLSAPDRGAKTADFKVIRESKVPAVLVETGFLSNPDEERRLGSPAYQRRVAEALADGILRFMASRGKPARR